MQASSVADQVSAELFAERERQITSQIESLESSLREKETKRQGRNEVTQAFADMASGSGNGRRGRVI